MTVRFTCPHCGHGTDISEQYVGQSGPCAGCGKTVTATASSDGTQTPCPRCGAALVPGAVSCGACGWRPAASTPGDLADDPVTRMLIPVGRSWLAIAAGYAGLFSVLCFPAPIALILGILAVVDLKKHPDKHGMGRALFGLISGALFTLLLVVFLIMGFLES